jgi:hypothetical protein
VPHCHRLPLAGYELDVTPSAVVLQSLTHTTMNVRLQLPPADGSVVTVIVDSTAGADFFLVSTCKLEFTATNWNVYQPVHIIPIYAPSAVPSPVRVLRHGPGLGLKISCAVDAMCLLALSDSNSEPLL